MLVETPPTQQALLFSAAPGLRWVEIDDKYIVFNPLSDETHKLNPMAAAALSELETGQLDLDSLGKRMANLMETPISNELLLRLRELLSSLDEIGLILVSTNSPHNETACPPNQSG